VESIQSSKLFTTRKGTVILGIGAAVLAAVVLLVYLREYRNNVKSGGEPVSVLVAKSLIQQGTPGDVIGTTKLYETSSIPKDQVKTAAFVDPASLSGQVAVTDIFPGQQLTADEFAPAATGALTQKLDATQRASEFTVSGAAALGGQLVPGNKVDVWIAINAQKANGVTRPVVVQLMQNVPVLSITSGSGNNGVTFRATPTQIGQLIYATQNGTVWLSLRPTVGGTINRQLVVDASSLIGKKAIQVPAKSVNAVGGR
jgi:pilus assembly protein CpaB